jgi:DNA invertase Pin-like site-specific DNA recombinase
MATRRRIGISYGRFSDPKQEQGDSERRQQEEFRDFCQRHSLTPLRAREYMDRGRSGYKDDHRKKGKLGELIAEAKAGTFEPGSVIVVEAWDRLGRLRPDRQTELVAELLRTGVDIGVCRLNDVFTEEDFGTHKWTTLAVFIQLAYQESKQKAERVGKAWAEKRRRARAGECQKATDAMGNGGRKTLTRKLPAWVEMAADGTLRLVPERAAVVKRIFRMAAEGLGVNRTVAALAKAPEDGGAAAFGRSGRWVKSYVSFILNDRRAVGELQLMKDGKPDGPPLAGYYPAAVTEEEFDLARAGTERRTGKDRLGRLKGPHQAKHPNVFKGLLVHARDGSTMTLRNRGTRAKPHLALINCEADEGRGRCYTFPYPVFEEAVLGLLREVDPRDVLPREKAGPSRADTLRARLKNVRHDLAGLKADLQASYSRALADVLRAKEAEEEAVAVELQDELAKASRPPDRAWRELPGLVEMIGQGGDEARLRLAAVLRCVIADMWLLVVRRGSWRLAVVQVYFADSDRRRDYLIVTRPAVNGRPGGWWARSLSDAVKSSDLDLRRPEDAAKLEATLAGLDLPLAAGGLAPRMEE